MTAEFVVTPPDPHLNPLPLKGPASGPFSFCEIAVRRRPRLSHARLCDLLDYDSKTGEFRWRKQMSLSAKAGDVAGTRRNDGYCSIKIKGRDYRSHQLAWFYMTGK